MFGGASGWLNSSTRLFQQSDTNRSPTASSASPSGMHRVEALIVEVPRSHPAVVKLPFCPNTTLALSPNGEPAPNGLLYSSTRLLPASATYRLPKPSTATSNGLQRLSRRHHSRRPSRRRRCTPSR